MTNRVRPSLKEENPWEFRIRRLGFLVGAILLHLVAFLLVATLVIWPAIKPPDEASSFHSVTIKIPPPPPLAPSSGGAAMNPQLEPDQTIVPEVAPPTAITSADSTAFKIDAPKVASALSSHPVDLAPIGTGMNSPGGGSTSGAGTSFGSASGTDNPLSGYFYDFKQTVDRQPTGMAEAGYLGLLTKYNHDIWDDSLFSPFYKSKNALYTGSYAISTRPSEAAPAAFNLQNEVKGGLWAIHYHAKVTAPAGQYRFAGFGDNVLIVKIRGETVLDGGWDSLTGTPGLHQSLPFVFPSYIRPERLPGGKNKPPFYIPNLKVGVPFTMDVAETVDMDILIGDCGGVCSFFLLVQNMNKTYASGTDGTPLIPFFQLNDRAAPTFVATEEHPPYSDQPEPWQPAN